MARRRLGVVLLLPEPVTTEVNALRRALGDHAYGAVPPHITLVPPVNVREEDIDTAAALLRAAAAGEREPLRVHLGPVRTFHPVTPVVYLEVGGDVEAIHRLRAAVFHAPLAREIDFHFVPHVTLGDEVDDAAITGAVASLGGYGADVVLDRVTLMEEGEDRIWRPIADATLGADGHGQRGGLSVELTAHRTTSPDAEARAAQNPLVVEGRVDGAVVGVARGRVQGERAWLDELVVVEAVRGQGVGAQLLRRFAQEAAVAGATELAAVKGATLVGFLDRMGFVRGSTDLFTRHTGP